jgi:hypothetical protein
LQDIHTSKDLNVVPALSEQNGYVGKNLAPSILL